MRIPIALLFGLLASVACPRSAIATPDGSPQSASVITTPQVTVVGTYRITKAKQPVVLVELWIAGYVGPLDFSQFRQDVRKLGPASEQVAYLEHELNESGTSGRELSFEPLLVKGKTRVAFFLHYPQYGQPLQTPFGAVSLPQPTARPKRLNFLKYDEPD
jgi:hypothetical protein